MKTQVELNADASEKIRYNDPAYPIYHCPGRLSDYPNYTALNHWHADLEFIVVHSGSMSYNVNGEILTLNSGEGLIVNARQMHYGFSTDRTECTFLCLLLHPQLLCPLPSFKRNLIDPLIENTAAPSFFCVRKFRGRKKSAIIFWRLKPDLTPVPPRFRPCPGWLRSARCWWKTFLPRL